MFNVGGFGGHEGLDCLFILDSGSNFGGGWGKTIVAEFEGGPLGQGFFVFSYRSEWPLLQVHFFDLALHGISTIKILASHLNNIFKILGA